MFIEKTINSSLVITQLIAPSYLKLHFLHISQ